MYLSDEEYKIVKQALDDAEAMQKKYEETIGFLEKHINFLTKIIIDNNLCEIVMEHYNKQFDTNNNQGELDIPIEKKVFHRSKSFDATITAVAE